jgi:hypothetical protein
MFMHTSLAQQYHKTLAELFSQLQVADSPSEREALLTRMHNFIPQLYVVDAHAAQHMDEAIRSMRHDSVPVTRAALHTMNNSLQRLYDTVHLHQEDQFVMLGPRKVFVKPMGEAELRSLVEKSRLLNSDHGPFLHALAAEPHVIEVFREADPQTLRPVMQRMGFPEQQALVFFSTHAVPSLVTPVEGVPSLKMARIRNGVQATLLHHRIL